MSHASGATYPSIPANVLRSKWAPQEHIFVEADLDALETITYNSFSNALKFSEPGGRIDIAIDVSESTVKLE